ncbi:SGNH/GDSL hydrolase family protein [Stutzerimonas stutzeri]|uniref:SGNH/GDSL hydrolase family protein n=1 Tax=Stutzerimonas stutzeri TaxID=316 RepID=UPI001C2F08B7|nr:SGNH/GDSL hydrolase family protein [Stutzerimonas stutzeri]
MDNLPITTPITATLLKGAIELEQTEFGVLPHRLPASARSQCPDPQLASIETEPSGVRLQFRTAATALELDVMPTRRELVGVPPRPKGIYDLCVDGQLVRQQSADQAAILRTDMSSGATAREPGTIQTLRFEGLAGHDKLVDIWLAHNEIVALGELHSNAPVRPVADEGRPIWLHHGSSISHGSNATSPTGIWPVVASRMAGVDLFNLGLSGNALLDPFVARTLRDMPADLISVKIGINLVNADLMRLRAFAPAVHGFLDTLREGHPGTPLLVIAPISCPIHETTPGPSMFDLEALAEDEIRFQASGRPDETGAGKLTLTIIREHLQAIVEQRSVGDANIHYLDGRELYGEQDHARLPLPDRLHPDAHTHLLIGERFAPLLRRQWRR